MKLLDLLSRPDSKETPYGGCEEFFYECLNKPGYNYADLEVNGFTERPIYKWLCTDAWVGISAIYWNKEFICITSQQGRKCSTEIQWASEEVFNRVSAFVKTLYKEEVYIPDYLDLEQDFQITFKLGFTEQIMNDWAYYEGKKCMIAKELTRNEVRKDFIAKVVWIETDDGPKLVDIRELDFPVLLKVDT
jgi:hypothetical protein